MKIIEKILTTLGGLAIIVILILGCIMGVKTSPQKTKLTDLSENSVNHNIELIDVFYDNSSTGEDNIRRFDMYLNLEDTSGTIWSFYMYDTLCSDGVTDSASIPNFYTKKNNLYIEDHYTDLSELKFKLRDGYYFKLVKVANYNEPIRAYICNPLRIHLGELYNSHLEYSKSLGYKNSYEIENSYTKTVSDFYLGDYIIVYSPENQVIKITESFTINAMFSALYTIN